tara:strand:+ start:652 stop:1266 length:615 start_codon:yes stop_codon:yes gene_type:complete
MHYKEKLEYNENGTIMLTEKNNIFSEAELQKLEGLVDELPFEHVEIGDADEPNLLEVGRLITDVEKPKLVNKSITSQVLDIVASKKSFQFYSYLLEKSELYIRRMQYNVLGQGCFVGLHLDTDSNPDYIVAVVIQLGGDFKGGNYVVYGGGKPPRSFSPTRFSTIFSDCRYEHEVTKVKSGFRKSLVFFLSSNNGKNSRNRESQ